jgi:hypothetical protein
MKEEPCICAKAHRKGEKERIYWRSLPQWGIGGREDKTEEAWRSQLLKAHEYSEKCGYIFQSDRKSVIEGFEKEIHGFNFLFVLETSLS